MFTRLTLAEIYTSPSFENTIRNERIDGVNFNIAMDNERTLLEEAISEGVHQSLPIALTLIKYGAVLTGRMFYNAERKNRHYKLSIPLAYHLSFTEYSYYLKCKIRSDDVCLSDVSLMPLLAVWEKERNTYFKSHFLTNDPINTIYVERMQGGDHNIPITINDKLITPLENAINQGNVDIVSALILHGAQVTKEIYEHSRKFIVGVVDDDGELIENDSNIVVNDDGTRVNNIDVYYNIHDIISFYFDGYYEYEHTRYNDSREEFKFEYNDYIDRRRDYQQMLKGVGMYCC